MIECLLLYESIFNELRQVFWFQGHWEFCRLLNEIERMSCDYRVSIQIYCWKSLNKKLSLKIFERDWNTSNSYFIEGVTASLSRLSKFFLTINVVPVAKHKTKSKISKDQIPKEQKLNHFQKRHFIIIVDQKRLPTGPRKILNLIVVPLVQFCCQNFKCPKTNKISAKSLPF